MEGGAGARSRPPKLAQEEEIDAPVFRRALSRSSTPLASAAPPCGGAHVCTSRTLLGVVGATMASARRQRPARRSHRSCALTGAINNARSSATDTPHTSREPVSHHRAHRPIHPSHTQTRVRTRPHRHLVVRHTQHTSPASGRPRPRQHTCAPTAPGHNEADLREAARAAVARARRTRPLGRPPPARTTPRRARPLPIAPARARGARGARFRPR